MVVIIRVNPYSPDVLGGVPGCGNCEIYGPMSDLDAERALDIVGCQSQFVGNGNFTLWVHPKGKAYRIVNLLALDRLRFSALEVDRSNP